MRRLLKWIAVVLGGVALCVFVGIAALLQSEGGRRFLEQSAAEAREFVGWKLFLVRIGVDQLMGTERAGPWAKVRVPK